MYIFHGIFELHLFLSGLKEVSYYQPILGLLIFSQKMDMCRDETLDLNFPERKDEYNFVSRPESKMFYLIS